MAKIGDERKRVCRIDRQRRQNREEMLEEALFQELALGGRKTVRRHHFDSLLDELCLKLVPDLVLKFEDPAHLLVDLIELLLGR